jgi:hypothetical protein
MSYLPPSEAGFFEAVQVYFTEITGRMALFGARDQELLEQWKAEGRSAQVVCRGIQQAVAAKGDDAPPPRSLYQCRGFVDREWEVVQTNTVGRHEEVGAAPEEKTHQDSAEVSPESEGLYAQAREVIEQAGKGTEQERWRNAYRQALRKLDRLREEREDFSFAELQAVDAALVEAYLEALDNEERRLIEESVASNSAGLARGMSPQARREHLLVQQKRALVERFGLLDLMESIF